MCVLVTDKHPALKQILHLARHTNPDFGHLQKYRLGKQLHRDSSVHEANKDASHGIEKELTCFPTAFIYIVDDCPPLGLPKTTLAFINPWWSTNAFSFLNSKL